MNRNYWRRLGPSLSVAALLAVLGGCTSASPYQLPGPPGMAQGVQPIHGYPQATARGQQYGGPEIQQVGYQPTLPPPLSTEPAGAPGGIRTMPAPSTHVIGGQVQGMPIQGMPGQGVPISHGQPLPMPGPALAMHGQPPAHVEPPLPRELIKSVMPPYVIEPPDTIFIDVIRAIPKPPYRVEPLDVLLVNVAETLPNQPIAGPLLVSPDGLINLGYSYGVVRVAGLTLEQVVAAVKLVLRSKLNDPQVGVGLAQFRGTATLRGEFMLTQDGTVTLGSYGSVPLAGLTLAQAKAAIEKHLSHWLMNPEVSVSVTGYNSKVYYVIFDGAGFGQQIYRFPITGNETVLDAISNLQGLPSVASKRKIWLARPAPMHKNCYQILPVDWEVITQAGATDTNWQLFPGDRLYVAADPWIEWDNHMAKVLAPFERILGITLLGASTYQNIRMMNQRGFNNGGTFVPVVGF